MGPLVKAMLGTAGSIVTVYATERAKAAGKSHGGKCSTPKTEPVKPKNDAIKKGIRNGVQGIAIACATELATGYIRNRFARQPDPEMEYKITRAREDAKRDSAKGVDRVRWSDSPADEKTESKD